MCTDHCHLSVHCGACGGSVSGERAPRAAAGAPARVRYSRLYKFKIVCTARLCICYRVSVTRVNGVCAHVYVCVSLSLFARRRLRLAASSPCVNGLFRLTIWGSESGL